MPLVAGQVGRDDLGHFVTGSDQSINHAAMQGALADRVNVRIGCPQMIVDRDPAARADVDVDLFRQIIARANAGRDDDHLNVERCSVVEFHPFDFAVAMHFFRGLIEMHLHAHRLDLFDERA